MSFKQDILTSRTEERMSARLLDTPSATLCAATTTLAARLDEWLHQAPLRYSASPAC